EVLYDFDRCRARTCRKLIFQFRVNLSWRVWDSYFILPHLIDIIKPEMPELNRQNHVSAVITISKLA
ncbi:hypothetical protein AALA22_09085, partial [Anaerovoracaceae bacterium 41-7]